MRGTPGASEPIGGRRRNSPSSMESGCCCKCGRWNPEEGGGAIWWGNFPRESSSILGPAGDGILCRKTGEWAGWWSERLSRYPGAGEAMDGWPYTRVNGSGVCCPDLDAGEWRAISWVAFESFDGWGGRCRNAWPSTAGESVSRSWGDNRWGAIPCLTSPGADG